MILVKKKKKKTINEKSDSIQIGFLFINNKDY